MAAEETTKKEKFRPQCCQHAAGNSDTSSLVLQRVAIARQSCVPKMLLIYMKLPEIKTVFIGQTKHSGGTDGLKKEMLITELQKYCSNRKMRILCLITCLPEGSKNVLHTSLTQRHNNSQN